MGATHKLHSAVKPTGGFSLQMWQILKRNKHIFKCKEALSQDKREILINKQISLLLILSWEY